MALPASTGLPTYQQELALSQDIFGSGYQQAYQNYQQGMSQALGQEQQQGLGGTTAYAGVRQGFLQQYQQSLASLQSQQAQTQLGLGPQYAQLGQAATQLGQSQQGLNQQQAYQQGQLALGQEQLQQGSVQNQQQATFPGGGSSPYIQGMMAPSPSSQFAGGGGGMFS